MVIARAGRGCSHGSCEKFPSFHVEGCSKAAYCKQHAKHGMGNVRRKRSPNVGHASLPTRCMSTAVAKNADTKRCRYNGSLRGVRVVSVSPRETMNRRKQSRRDLDVAQHTPRVDHEPVGEGGAVQVAAIVSRQPGPHTSSHRALPGRLHDSSETASRHTSQRSSNIVTSMVTYQPS